jgi:hypothetical protein
LPQHLNRGIPVNQFTTLGLRKARFDVGRNRFALFDHPVFEIELFADDPKRLIENLAGVLIRTGSHS